MADLGTIGTYNSAPARAAGHTPVSTSLKSPLPYATQRVIPAYRAATMAEWGAIDATGQLTGSVTAGGTPVVRCRVGCYWRENGNLVATVFTDTAGNFTIPYLDKSSSEYFVVALDPVGGTQYNAKVYDYLTPV